MNRYGEYGNDAAAHFTFFLTVLIYFNYLEKNFLFKKNDVFYIILIFSIFAFLNKTFLIITMLIPLFVNPKILIKKNFNLKLFIICFFLFAWIIKNYLSTGCAIYPVPITCLDFIWTNMNFTSNVFDVAIGSEAWAKDWSNQKNEVLSYTD